MIVIPLYLVFFKCKKLLTDIIDKHKQPRAHQHGYVLDYRLAEVHALQCIARQGQCQAIGYQIAHDDVQCKLDDASPVVALIVEGEMLVQEIAEDAAEEVVAERADPVAAAKDVVEHKHDSRAKQRVDHSYNEKGQERLIEYFLLHSPCCTSQNTVSAISA